MTKKETEELTICRRHYEMSIEDLDTRRDDMDNADELFRSYIDEDDWPYSSLIFIPKVFTSIFEKTSRLIGNKPRGRLVPRENGDVLGAKINNELLSYQWDSAAIVDGEPLVAKWAQMDMNARKYGASFGLIKWQTIRRLERENRKDGTFKFKSVPYFDGPYFQTLNNRDVLYNPSYSTIKNWCQVREYVTLKELMATNDVARGEPIYKNLDELKGKVKEEMKTMDTRATNYTVRNKTIKTYQDFLGQDEYNKTIEIVTEYREEKWVTFAPKHGVVIRDIQNPYKHQQIPIVLLKYYPIDDDLYGLSEIEPIEKLQKALNAISSQYIDAVNMELYPVFGVDSTRVRLHTMEFTPRAKWIVSGDPRTAITKMDFSAPNAIGQFKTAYQLFSGEIAEGMGDTSAQTSNLNTFSEKKTATEIKDLATQRLARDNFNQVFLSEAIKRQMMFWHSMNQQFFFEPGETQKIVRIVGKDAIDYFQNTGLDQSGLTEEATNSIVDAEAMGNPVNPEEYQTPLYPVQTEQGMEPKMNIGPTKEYAELRVEPEDLIGNYDYIADIESMAPPNQEQVLATKKAAVDLAINPQAQQALASEGKRIKLQELLEDYYENLGFKDAGKYFEELPVNPMNAQGQGLIPSGAAGAPPGFGGQGNVPNQGLGGTQTMAGGPNPQLMARPPAGQI